MEDEGGGGFEGWGGEDGVTLNYCASGLSVTNKTYAEDVVSGSLPRTP